MSDEIKFVCARCRKPAVIRAEGPRQQHVACPHCGAMNRMGERSVKKNRRRLPLVVLAIVIVPLALVGMSWALTMTLGADSLRPEIAQLARGRRNAVISIKVPAPFVLTYTISVAGGEGQASMMIRKYYYWFVLTKREVPEDEVPEAIRRVWQ